MENNKRNEPLLQNQTAHYLLLLLLAASFFQVYQIIRIVLLKYNLHNNIVAYMLVWVILVFLMVIIADYIRFWNVIPI